MPDREPYNDKYCKEVNCHWRHGIKCTEASCLRNGNKKRARYFTVHGVLADGDVPENA